MGFRSSDHGIHFDFGLGICCGILWIGYIGFDFGFGFLCIDVHSGLC